MTRTALVVDRVTVTYGRSVVLREVTVTATPGRVLAVTGLSGAGKTTLLWTMAGLVRPVSGAVTLNRAPLRGHAHAVEEGVVLVPQEDALVPGLTAEENVRVALAAARVVPGEARQRVAEAFDWLGLSDQAGQLAGQLSGGQRQRVALARGVAMAGPVLLADEVTSELDAANRQRVIEVLRARAGRGVAVVFATHDAEAAAACDDEVCLVDGYVRRVRG